MSAVDSQTLALIDEGMVFSWGDGDFGKLGRGGNEGCAVPANLDKFEWNGYNPDRVWCSVLPGSFKVRCGLGGRVITTTGTWC